jgi:ATP-dependent DNA ligase
MMKTDFEIKWDGYRAVADLSTDQPLFYSRNGISFFSNLKKYRGILKSDSSYDS